MARWHDTPGEFKEITLKRLQELNPGQFKQRGWTDAHEKIPDRFKLTVGSSGKEVRMIKSGDGKVKYNIADQDAATK